MLAPRQSASAGSEHANIIMMWFKPAPDKTTPGSHIGCNMPDMASSPCAEGSAVDVTLMQYTPPPHSSNMTRFHPPQMQVLH
jgi:hypothetical protein